MLSKRYYAASTGGFYHERFHEDGIPKDAVEITPEEHAILLDAQAVGRVIRPDANGRPVAVDVVLTPEQQAATVRAERDMRLVSTNWMVERHTEQQAASITTDLTSQQYIALLTYRQALRDIPAQKGFPWNGDITAAPWPTLE